MKCSHAKRREVGATVEGAGDVLIYWCPDCGALKRTMTNWKYTDHPWQIPALHQQRTARRGEGK